VLNRESVIKYSDVAELHWELRIVKLATLYRTLIRYREDSEAARQAFNALNEDVKFLKEQTYKGIWVMQELGKHLPPEVLERVLVDAQVNSMDPDFSFEKAVELRSEK